MKEVQRPILRYHGGKWRLAEWIIQHLAPHHTYVEPFGGAASVLLRKPRSSAEIYNDLDSEVVNLFRMARDRGDELRNVLALTPFAREEFAASYSETADPLERARRMVLRSFQGFGSAAASGERTGFRSTSVRSGTSPAVDWRNYPDALATIIERLQGVVIEHRDALAIMEHHDRPSTLHYVDPPYVHSTRSTKVRHTSTGKSYRYELSDEEHLQLATFLQSRQGMVVLSGYPCALYDDLYKDWYRVSRQAYADGARGRTECLWLNPSAFQGLSQFDFFAAVPDHSYRPLIARR
ncbi:DNA adenine methylase [Pseudomonas putida CSV86]|uniref:DNA adenine methylase n=1 Tax=Pseudomonas bharatica CSV86 TaxID=1005395 RepID=L1M088_9PSED|nr:DNA adenine methylase [Pseudomonas bharatica]NNJ16988.1 DNA adenine methylase [Pseudomonas bharatica CSV86]